MDNCLTCGGLIMEPGRAYGYGGQVCHCPVRGQFQQPTRQYQTHPFGLDPMSTPSSTIDILNRLERIENMLLKIQQFIDTPRGQP